MAGQQRKADIILDDAAFQRELAKEVAKLKLRTVADLDRFAFKVQRAARQFAPVDTGRLRNSIGITSGKDSRGEYRDVGTNVEYAAAVEYGFSRSPAQPYLRPAIAEAVRDGLR